MTEIDWMNTKPDDWPHTPPLYVMRDLLAKDSNLFWRLDIGHIQNTLEEALDALEEARATKDMHKERFEEMLARVEAAEAAVERVRLYCENQGDKFRYHAGRILTALAPVTEEGDRE